MRYLDHAATTPLRPSVVAAMAEAPALANPASTHRAGQRAAALLEEARERIAQALDAHPTEVVLTSGGTESTNLALQGMARVRPGALVVPDGEHHATLDTAEALAAAGREVRWVPISRQASIDHDAFAAALEGAALATSIWVSNEIGTVQDVAALAALARTAGVPMHVDAVQALGHLPVSARSLGLGAAGATTIGLSAHKVGGPVGVGVLLVARDAPIAPIVHGGGQQRGLRSGTQDVLGAHCASIAIAEAVEELASESARLAALRDRVLAVGTAVPGVVATAPSDACAPHVAHLAIEGAEPETIVFTLDRLGFAVSNGSACTAGVQEPSHVLAAMGLGHLAPLRVSLGRTTTSDDVDALCATLPGAIATARAASA
ncbi:cysteine desulfurase family protein [Agrococcus sp. SGAir0287]|uniref:cysteine desulfurase family protein n=1 Tax=Agrococcus sp. SGAir0287 TaxID=2070347 RepID=UPI0010CD10CD|nr:aminotransferase class V-fold PLP-dependent enzyme [Agrococcus sp. SGAir0287]QCR19003.1 cysteine desulfurase NifS [Agrococcus sp. SGAir0287]